jgi:nucleotide-binding universal stress UspA family protein
VTFRDEAAPRRILVALDASRTSLDALRAAAALAARLGAELTGLFVEDENLLRLAGLPVARQLSVHGGTGRPVADIEGELRALAARAREAVAAAAAPHRISWSFRVARGQVAVEVVSAAGEADLLVLGWAGHRVAGRRGPGETARAAAARSPSSVRILSRDVQVGRPLLVAWDGSPGAARALDLAARREAAGRGTMTLLLAAPERTAGARLLEEARGRLGRREPPPSRHAGPRPADLLRAAAGPGALLVLGAESALPGGPAGLKAFLDEVSCPVLLAR